ncbi:MAG: GAF domain-containing protein [Pleurocapsa sp. MO_192.B19]|nr:GAF domain-containing protein [Pleurocapsa sp. MO_192.B19]
MMLDRFFHPRQDQHGSKVADLNHVMKASQSIMSEILLERLLPKLLKMILEMTKATKGLIVLAKKTGLEIAAIGTLEQTIEISLRSLQLESSNLLPISVINYVAQTQQLIWLSSATKQGNFTTDPYIKENQSKTVLCLPLLGKRNKLIAVIYLENNLFADAFQPQQVSILKLMSIPAGLCIENAQLYKQLENYSDALEDKVQKLKRSEQVLRGQTAVLTNTLNVLTQEPELDKLLETVLSAIALELNAASSVLWLYNSERDTISHYMSHQADLDIGFSQPSPPSQIYHQASEHPFWQMLITCTEYKKL